MAMLNMKIILWIFSDRWISPRLLKHNAFFEQTFDIMWKYYVLVGVLMAPWNRDINSCVVYEKYFMQWLGAVYGEHALSKN